jgi:ribosome-binding protein aMBF1 (putative translation factor)
MPDGQWSLFDERPKCASCGDRIDGPKWQVRAADGAILVVCAMCAHNPWAAKRQMPSA